VLASFFEQAKRWPLTNQRTYHDVAEKYGPARDGNCRVCYEKPFGGASTACRVKQSTGPWANATQGNLLDAPARTHARPERHAVSVFCGAVIRGVAPLWSACCEPFVAPRGQMITASARGYTRAAGDHFVYSALHSIGCSTKQIRQREVTSFGFCRPDATRCGHSAGIPQRSGDRNRTSPFGLHRQPSSIPQSVGSNQSGAWPAGGILNTICADSLRFISSKWSE